MYHIRRISSAPPVVSIGAPGHLPVYETQYDAVNKNYVIEKKKEEIIIINNNNNRIVQVKN